MNDIINQAKAVTNELCETANLKKGQIVVVGCSSSEISGQNLGTASSEEIGKAVFDAIYDVLSDKGIYLAAQCCEHLNRAIIIEEEAVNGREIVSVIPQPKAGGSFATAAYKYMKNPVAVEHIKAHAGMDIGDTLIGMHLRDVAVPVRLSSDKIGEAHVVCARTRAKFIGGSRAVYDNDKL